MFGLFRVKSSEIFFPNDRYPREFHNFARRFELARLYMVFLPIQKPN